MGMNVVHSGSTFQIYGEALKTYDKLPLGTYEICFSKMTGFYLTSHADLAVNEKIYGSTPEKVEKVLKGFGRVDRNFGVILSGKKGIGKSLFARQLAIRAKDYNLPMIIVSCYFPGIADFIGSIEQEVVVFFDEFEKTFGATDCGNPQEEMLSLFDGIDNGKKLFIITCNEVCKLNSYLINRPGRFHYHFTLGNPTPDEIKEYMIDKLNPEYHGIIKRLIGFSFHADMTYDILRAIAFEINNGYSFEETLADLNISKEGTLKYNIAIEFADGQILTATERAIDIYSTKREYQWIYGNNNDAIRLGFIPADLNIDIDSGEMILNPSCVEIYIDKECYDFKNPEEKARYNYLRQLEIKKISFIRVINNCSFKYVI